MQSVDLNLLAALDALLAEGSVTGAAQRLHLSPPAVSRSLARLRRATGDPLLVRVGRDLVPTPEADRLRERVHAVHVAAQELLGPRGAVDEATLDATFAVRTGHAAAAALGPALLAAIRPRAPRVRLRLVGEGDESVAALRDGAVDLDVGAASDSDDSGELHREVLRHDRMVLVGRHDGALARRDAVTPEALAEVGHVNATRRGRRRGPLDDALATRGLARDVVATVPDLVAAFALVRAADLVTLAPRWVTDVVGGADLVTWEVPLDLPPLVIEQSWHPRTDTDPARRWLRDRVREVVALR
ncbi:LysR family transcriptional regulator [Actinomycetospora sp. NBRC 106375]|uniref:LysR family transcriptional regulator n=1 Tax=Actinomycetospora sp. NBRC 106375 TaxID=3032207 RepID=UPI002554935D|nr:LysR family transcriptional regulator [Actinomycetospora sp. NBRC 106375]